MRIRLLICAVLVAPLPIALVRSLELRRGHAVAAPPGVPLGVRVVREGMPHASTATLQAPRAPRRESVAHRSRATSAATQPSAALVTYVVPATPTPAKVATPAVSVRHPRTSRSRPVHLPTMGHQPPEPAPVPPAAASVPAAPAAPPAATPATPAVIPTQTTPTSPAVPPPAPTTTAFAAAASQPTKPGNGYGDKNHAHSGPPGHEKNG